ncbi:MAG: hypothetical protein IJS93_03355 [Clostridia bacterium]|nr:hypothetical protein [Clostridia bacterium]
MRIREVGTNDLNVIKYDEFLGVDYSESGDKRLAKYALNLVDENGVRKRKGARETHRFDGAVKGIFEISLSGYSGTLVYAGTTFYFDDGGGYRALNADHQDLINATTSVFYHDDKVFIIGAGAYLVLGDWGNGLEIKRVADSPEVYVPTTTVGITATTGGYYKKETLDENSRGIYFVKESEGYSRVVLDGSTDLWDADSEYYSLVAASSIPSAKLEAANLLTPYRKNTLFGSEESTSSYRLDSNNLDNDGKTVVTITTVESGERVVRALTERSTGNVERGINAGDDLKGKTLTITPSNTPVTRTVLRNGKGSRGKTVIKGKGIDVFWAATGTSARSWNTASLIASYQTASGLQSDIVATATRPNTYSPYTVTYLDKTITLSSAYDYTVDFYEDVADATERITAYLPSETFELIDENDVVLGSIDHVKGVVNFTAAFPSPDGNANIEVLFKSRSDLNESLVSGCSFGTLFGVDGNADRLFLSGNSTRPNWDFCSASNDFGYFPEDGISVLGESEGITGYLRLSDSALAILKKGGKSDSTVFVRRGAWSSSSVIVGGETYRIRKAEFSVVGSYVAEGSVSPFCVSHLNGEPIFLSERGLYGIRTSESKATEQRFTYERGKYVDPLIAPLDKSNALSISYDGKFYLFIGGKVIVGEEKRIKGQNLFWLWNDLPVSAVGVVGGKMLLGREDGRIMEFWEGYYDVIYRRISSGEFSLSNGEKAVEIAETTDLILGSTLVFNGDVYTKIFSNCTVENGKIKADVTKLGAQTVYAANVGDSGLTTQTPYLITDIDLDEGTFRLKGDSVINLSSGGFDLYINLSGVELEVYDITFTLDNFANDLMSLSFRGAPVTFDAYLNEMPSNLTADVITKRAVVAEWKSQETDLGDSTVLKAIKGVNVDVGKGSTGEIAVLAFGGGDGKALLEPLSKTRITSSNYQRLGFRGALTKNFRSRLNIRDVNYFAYAIVSLDGEPFELKKTSFEYVYTRKNRGMN